MANVGYVRVSTIEQNEGRQVEALKSHSIDKWFVDKCSGKNTDRPQFRAMLDYVREGDTIYVEDFSRLSRSLLDLCKVMDRLQAEHVSLVSLKEQFDMGTAAGRMIVRIIGTVNQFELENLHERQREGIACAKAKGVYKGRKRISKPDNWQDVFTRWKRREITGAQAMKELDLRRNTFYNFVKLENTVGTENNI